MKHWCHRVKILHSSESEPGLTQAVDSDTEYCGHLASIGHVSISEGFSQHRKSLNSGSGPGWVCQLPLSNQEKGSLPPYPRPKNLPISKRSQILRVCLYLHRTRTELGTDLLPRSVKRILLWHGVHGSHCRPLQTQWQVWSPRTLVGGGISPATFPARTAKSGTEAHGS